MPKRRQQLAGKCQSADNNWHQQYEKPAELKRNNEWPLGQEIATAVGPTSLFETK
jgi:hypothetical protein